MARAYSKDLRSRIVDSYKNREGSMRKLAKRYQVSKNFIYRLLKRNRQEGTILPKPQGGSQPIQGTGEKYLRCVKAEPDLRLEALRERYYQVFGDELGITTIHDTLKRWGISRKKNSFMTPNKKLTGYNHSPKPIIRNLQILRLIRLFCLMKPAVF